LGLSAQAQEAERGGATAARANVRVRLVGVPERMDIELRMSSSGFLSSTCRSASVTSWK